MSCLTCPLRRYRHGTFRRGVHRHYACEPARVVIGAGPSAQQMAWRSRETTVCQRFPAVVDMSDSGDRVRLLHVCGARPHFMKVAPVMDEEYVGSVLADPAAWYTLSRDVAIWWRLRSYPSEPSRREGSY